MTIQPTPYDKDYEITDAMFGAFRSPGGAAFFWKLFAWSVGLFFVVGMIVLAPLISGYGDFMMMAAHAQNDQEQAKQFVGFVGKFFLFMFLAIVVYTFLVAIIRSAFFRAYFFDEVSEGIPFRLGADEVRQTLSILGYYAIITLGMTLALIAIIIPVTILGIVAGDSPVLFILGMLIGYVVSIAVYIWLGVRLNPAGALTAITGDIRVLAANKVSKNRFWALFGAILVAGIIGYVVNYIASTAAMLTAFSNVDAGELAVLLTGVNPDQSAEIIANMTSSGRFSLSSIIATLLIAVAYSFYILIMAGPQAFFTKQWADAGGMTQGHIETEEPLS